MGSIISLGNRRPWEKDSGQKITMSNPVPKDPKIYYIVHLGRLGSIVDGGYILCGREVEKQKLKGIEIGMDTVKRRRMKELRLSSHKNIYVGDCTPFYFCPRSVMLYLLHKGNHPDISYTEGQEPIVHLEANLYESVEWADANNRCWAFTSSNAGSRYFEDYADLKELHRIDWNAVQSQNWIKCKEEKQAEFLIEYGLSFGLVKNIGVQSKRTKDSVLDIVSGSSWQPNIKIVREWYY